MYRHLTKKLHEVESLLERDTHAPIPEFIVFYGTRWFIAVFTTARCSQQKPFCTQALLRSYHAFMYSEVSVVVLSLQETTASLHAFLMSLMHATCPALLRFDPPVNRMFVVM
jgi:hypothetical protein